MADERVTFYLDIWENMATGNIEYSIDGNTPIIIQTDYATGHPVLDIRSD